MPADELPLERLELTWLVEDGVGDRDFADVVELGGVADPLDLVALQPEAARVPRRAPRRPRGAARARGCFRPARVPARPCSAAWPTIVRHSFVRTCAGRRSVAPRWRSGLAWEHDRAERTGDAEALAVLGERAGGATDDRLGDLVAGREQRAELVAAHPVGAAAALQVVLKGGAQPHEQRVAGGVAEGVVVLLEAIEVEEHEHQRVAVVGSRESMPRARAPARAGCPAR